MIFLLLYMVFKSAAEAAVLIFPTFYAMSGGLILQWLLGYNFSVAVWVGYIALFGIAVETGVVMVVYLHEALQHRLGTGHATDRRRSRAGRDRRCGAASAPQADDRDGCDSQPRADPVGVRHRIRRDETDRRAHRRWHDHINDSRADIGSGVFLADEGTRFAERNAETAEPWSSWNFVEYAHRITIAQLVRCELML